jgi:hypothetical protein
MKTAALFLGGLLLSALASGPAAAESVRVRLTARVTEVNDPGNGLAGKIVLGSRVNGLYVYNTNTPNTSTDPFRGDYRPYANEARMRFAAGSFVFESVQPTQNIVIHTDRGGQFLMISFDNKPLANGYVNDMSVQLINNNGAQSVALPTGAPNLSDYSFKDVTISGNNAGQSFFLRAQIEVAELIVPDVLQISPASGSFAANQRFDAALILPRNSNVTFVRAMANGVPAPFNYPGNCQLQPQVGTGRPSLLCLDAQWALMPIAGAPIEWTVELANGTILTETVTWTLAP